MSASMTWRGHTQVSAQMDEYTKRVYRAVNAVANYFAPVLETFAKQNATWIDRTANARQTLYAFVRDESPQVVRLFLSHGMEYGKWLEVRWQGKYAIIWPTLSQHFRQITDMLQAIFD